MKNETLHNFFILVLYFQPRRTIFVPQMETNIAGPNLQDYPALLTVCF